MIGVSKDRKLNEADRVNIVLYEKKLNLSQILVRRKDLIA
jgi:hypothetical protein